MAYDLIMQIYNIRAMDFNLEKELDFRSMNGHDTYFVYFLMMKLF